MAENYVCDGAKIECPFCTKPEGTLMVTSNTVKVQGKTFVTAKDNQKPNLLFEGNCTKSPFSLVPCLAAIVPGEWEGTADLKVQDAPALLEGSTIMCNYGGSTITITDPLQVNQPGQLQPVAAPVIDPVEEPEIPSLEWKSNQEAEDENETSDIPDQSIEKTAIDKKVWIEIITQNILPGNPVTITLTDEDDTDSDPMVLSATVDSTGKAAVLLNTKKTDTQNWEAYNIAETNDDQPSGRRLVEEGMVIKGYTKNEGNREVIVDIDGKKGYDWTYADAPDEALMRQNGMTDYDIRTINYTKSIFTIELKAKMLGILWLFSDVEDGFGKNGISLANHFFTGGGSPYIFDTNSNPAREIKDSSQFKDNFLTSLKEELKQLYDEEGFVNKYSTDNYRFSTALPYYSPVQGAINPNTNEVATFIGGIQGARVDYEIYKDGEATEVVIKKVSFLDTFGAGWEDGGANGMMKQWIPGLVEMFCLQHFKNVSDRSKFQPFMIIVNIEL